MSARWSCAPRRPSSSAVARPIPDPAPVTTATLPARLISSLIAGSGGYRSAGVLTLRLESRSRSPARDDRLAPHERRGAVLKQPEELTAEWLGEALRTGPVGSFKVEPVGTGQMSESRRVTILYARDADSGPVSVVLKTASADETSRSTGVSLGVYDREVRFYRELAPRIGGPLPECHLAAIDPDGWFTLLLEDVAPAVQGDQIAGASVGDARLAMHELAKLHAPVFADPQLGATPWLNQGNVLNQALLSQLLPAFLTRYGGAWTQSTPRSAAASSRAWTAGTPTAGRRSAWCTATTASTTCCSGTRTPPGASWRSTGRRSAGAR